MSTPEFKLADAVGARMLGDDYQHVLTLMHAIRLLIETSGVISVGMEVDQAGNVDDLVVRFRDAPARYHQVKFSRTAGKVIDHAWFTDKGGAKKSPLQRFYESYRHLTTDAGPPEMALVTNRSAAADDPVLVMREGYDDRLVPRWALEKEGSKAGQLRATWADHLGISEAELLEMLKHLQIKLAQGSMKDLLERCGEVMLAAGLRHDENAISLGYNAIRTMIEEGCCELDREAMTALIERLEITAEEKMGTLLVQGMDHVPFADSATISIDWVELYEGQEATERRELKDPARVDDMLDDLRQARAEIEAAGHDRVLVVGAFRLGTAFAVGSQLTALAGFELAIKQGATTWTTDGEKATATVDTTIEALSGQDDIAVCVSISNDIAAEVTTYIEQSAAHSKVAKLVNVVPRGGPSRDALADDADARALTQAILDEIRTECRGIEGQLHLFISAPRALALMLGHVWNRVPATIVYEDLNPGYQATFRLARS